MKTDSGPLQYSPVAIALHWIVAAFILIDFALAESFSRFNPGDALYFTWAYPAHMSIGMCALVIGAGRLLWRGSHPYPRVPQDMNLAARMLASATHVMLYVFMVAAPVTGWVVLSVRKKPPVLFGSLHWPNIGYLADLARTQRAAIHDLLLPGHIILSYLGMGLVALHVVAGLYHHFWRRDNVLRRMLRAIPGPRLDDKPRV
jgi:cytochrome b561